MSHGLDGSRRPDPFTEPAADGPTELVPNEKGDLVERLSAGTATILLVWLIGIYAIIWGVLLIVRAFQARSAPAAPGAPISGTS